MTLMILVVGVIFVLGAWALIFTPHFFNTKQTQATVILVARIIFIIAAVLVFLMLIGAVPNKGF